MTQVQVAFRTKRSLSASILVHSTYGKYSLYKAAALLNTHTTKQSTSTIHSIKPHTVANAERSRTAFSTSQTSPVITFSTKGPPTTQHTHTTQPPNTTETTQATQDTQTIQTTRAAHNAKTINCDTSTTYRIKTHTIPSYSPRATNCPGGRRTTVVTTAIPSPDNRPPASYTTQLHATSSCFGQSGCPVGGITVTPYPTGAATVRRKVSAMSVAQA
ncbi:hypothetical protein H634G_11374 [Metarhizium anisopliae BRIP 53293]|uniref:Uncharacterized protein n=1 Tax=Metarhizium anisopliae BRIP 53293 TaxID=1291518 RepID=A0A0D9NHK5_METAN|nr:hypothetical protein H634G_11374 [Metarhizium anisopliae BRIP 53293]